MAKYIIVASDWSAGPPRYFEGFNDYGIVGEPRWGLDPQSAVQFSALEVETERLLLVMLCPNLLIDSHRINEYFEPKPI